MAFRFRKITEMAADVKQRIAALNLFAADAVQVYNETRWERLKTVVENVVTTPAAIIVPGRGDNPDTGNRNSRRVGFLIFLVSGYNVGAAEDFYPIADLADQVMEQFVPAEASKNTPVTINGVQYEVTGFEPINITPAYDLYQVNVLSFDYRQNRT